MRYIWRKDGMPFGECDADDIEEAAEKLLDGQSHRRLVRDFTSETLIILTSHNGHEHTLSQADGS